MDRTAAFLKERWWLILIVAVVAILLLVPTKSGLPGKDHKGCENIDPQYKSYCLTTQIKSISQESGGSTSITLPIAFSDGTSDITFHLKGDRGLKVGDTVFVNLAEWDKRAYLFINSDSNLLVTILDHVFNASPAATAVIDLNTMQETKAPTP